MLLARSLLHINTQHLTPGSISSHYITFQTFNGPGRARGCLPQFSLSAEPIFLFSHQCEMARGITPLLVLLEEERRSRFVVKSALLSTLLELSFVLP